MGHGAVFEDWISSKNPVVWIGIALSARLLHYVGVGQCLTARGLRIAWRFRVLLNSENPEKVVVGFKVVPEQMRILSRERKNSPRHENTHVRTVPIRRLE